MIYGSLIYSKKWLSERPNCRGMFLRLEGITLLEWCERRSCPSLSGCHLAVSQNWASNHTSSGRADSGLSADLKILNFWNLLAIFQTWFLGVLGSTSFPLHFGLSLCNPLKQIRLPYPIWKGTCIPFIWGRVAWSASRGYRVTGPVLV